VSIPSWPDGTGRRILTLAGNDLTVDARARKTASSLADSGHRVIAVGLDVSDSLPRHDDIGGALLHRITPDLDPRLSPRLSRWGYAGLVNRLREASDVQRQRLQASRRNLVAGDRLAATEVIPAAEFIAGWIGRVLRLLWADTEPRARVVSAVRGRIGAAVCRVSRSPRRLHTVAIQRRYQVTSITYRALVRGQKRRSRRFKSWRRDLPEMHAWEVALGPVVDELQPELVHCHDIFHLGLAVRARARATAPFPIVYDAQEFIPGLPSDPWRRAAYMSLEAEYIRHADAIVTVSDGLSELLEDRYGVTSSIVMNAPNREPAADVVPLRSIVGLRDDDVLLSFVGGLAPDRGADVLIKALECLSSDVHVVFVTNAVGGYCDELVELAAGLGVGERVHFAPFVEPEAVTAYISSSSLSVIALSRDVINYEIALPNKLFQAVHAGLPVVVSDNPEMKRFVETHGVGEVYAGGDAASLAAGVERAVSRMRDFAPRLADHDLLDRFSWERQAEILLSVYADVWENSDV